MPKLPSLIVPVTIDSSGVDRGINNVNNKLRRGSRFSAAGGGGAGFGGGGGGSLASTLFGGLIGGAVASSAGRRQEVEQKQQNRIEKLAANTKKQLEYRRNNPLSRMLQNYAEKNFAIAEEVRKKYYQPHLYGTWEGRNIPMAVHHQHIGKVMGARAERIGRAYAGIRGQIRGIGSDIMGAIPTSGLGKFGLAGAIGTGVVAAGSFNRRMSQRFSDLTRFEGTTDYQRAYQYQQAFKKPGSELDLIDQFFMGGGPKGAEVASRVSSGINTAVRNYGQAVLDPTAALQSKNPMFGLAFGPGGQIAQAIFNKSMDYFNTANYLKKAFS